MTITNDQFKKLIGGFGFETFEPSALSEFSDSLSKIVHKSMGQTGGRVSMPGEYFGYMQNGYTSDPSGTNQAMSGVDVARYPLPETFPHSGGSGDIHVDKLFEQALKQYRQSGGGKFKLKKEQKTQAKHMFKNILEIVFKEVRKVAKKTKALSGAQMKRVMKKM